MSRVSPASILLVARGAHMPETAAAIKAAVAAVDAEMPWVSLTTLESVSGAPLNGLRSGTWIGGGLGVCALVLAAIGLHAVLAYMIRRRTHEIGIRLAVGANPKAILWLVLRPGLNLTLAGTLLGLAAAVPLTYVLRAGFVGLSLVDPVALLAPLAVLLLVGLLAAAGPAVHAASLDPIVVLRER
jgi:putative ABC transport system permease protein